MASDIFNNVHSNQLVVNCFSSLMVNGAALYHIPLQIMLVIAVIAIYFSHNSNSHRLIDVTRVYWAVYI